MKLTTRQMIENHVHELNGELDFNKPSRAFDRESRESITTNRMLLLSAKSQALNALANLEAQPTTVLNNVASALKPALPQTRVAKRYLVNIVMAPHLREADKEHVVLDNELAGFMGKYRTSTRFRVRYFDSVNVPIEEEAEDAF
ncbi:hypothetical protein [Paenibacillus xylanexedens]|uniref:hypothetical protein n=1 Tax=Paenibacillus xylanexedens TaxID=528191 RepID=UPI0011A019FC|nr:hypothetical protein [Paenibacillus xylanexedens]